MSAGFPAVTFRAFMGSILADTRFSAIRGERPEAY